jgi:hypothetical protein
VKAKRPILAALAALSLAGPASAEEAKGEAVDTSGHRFRVAFDPASRVTLGGAASLLRGADGRLRAAGELQAGLAYRSVDISGRGKERVSWQVEHRVVTGWLAPGRGAWAGAPACDAAAYGVSVLRHDELPSLVIPASPPVGIPFPFDVGFDAEVGRVSTSALTPALHVGAARAALLLDPLRARLPGRILTFGVGARYDLDVVPGARVVHRVAPMTAGSLRLRLESRDGLMLADARGEVAPHYVSEGGWAVLARASLHLERTLFALSDQPITADLDGAYRFDPHAGSLPQASDVRVSLGLAMHLNLR